MTDDELAELDSCALLLLVMVLVVVADSVRELDDRSFRLRSLDVVFGSVVSLLGTGADRFGADRLLVFDSFLRFGADCLFGTYSVSSVSVCLNSLVSLSLRNWFSTDVTVLLR